MTGAAQLLSGAEGGYIIGAISYSRCVRGGRICGPDFGVRRGSRRNTEAARELGLITEASSSPPQSYSSCQMQNCLHFLVSMQRPQCANDVGAFLHLTSMAQLLMHRRQVRSVVTRCRLHAAGLPSSCPQCSGLTSPGAERLPPPLLTSSRQASGVSEDLYMPACSAHSFMQSRYLLAASLRCFHAPSSCFSGPMYSLRATCCRRTRRQQRGPSECG